MLSCRVQHQDGFSWLQLQRPASFSQKRLVRSPRSASRPFVCSSSYSLLPPSRNMSAPLPLQNDPHKAGLWASSPRARATQTFKAHTFAACRNLNWSIVRLFFWEKHKASRPFSRSATAASQATPTPSVLIQQASCRPSAQGPKDQQGSSAAPPPPP